MSGKKLEKGSSGYNAIEGEVNDNWNEHGADIRRWPAPKEVYLKHEQVLMPYGPTEQKRRQKTRGLWMKLANKKFEDNGHDRKVLMRADAALAAEQAPPATPINEGVFFGAAQQGIENINLNDGGDDAEGDNEEETLFDADNDEASLSEDDGSRDDDDDDEEEEEDIDNSSDDETAGLNNTATPPSAKKPKQCRDTATLNITKSDLDINIITPPTFTKNGRKLATITIYVAGTFKADQINAFVAQDGKTAHVTFIYDENWCNAVCVEAGDPNCGPGTAEDSSMREWIKREKKKGTDYDSSIKKKLVFNLPFIAEDAFIMKDAGGRVGSYAPAAEGQPMEIYFDIINGNNDRSCQIFLLVREKLSNEDKVKTATRTMPRNPYHHQQAAHPDPYQPYQPYQQQQPPPNPFQQHPHHQQQPNFQQHQQQQQQQQQQDMQQQQQDMQQLRADLREQRQLLDNERAASAFQRAQQEQNSTRPRTRSHSAINSIGDNEMNEVEDDSDDRLDLL